MNIPSPIFPDKEKNNTVIDLGEEALTSIYGKHRDQVAKETFLVGFLAGYYVAEQLSQATQS